MSKPQFSKTSCSQCGGDFGPGDSGFSHCEDHQTLLTALTRLSNEVIGSLPLMEPQARQTIGNTNYTMLMQRAEEARSVIRRVGKERI